MLHFLYNFRNLPQHVVPRVEGVLESKQVVGNNTQRPHVVRPRDETEVLKLLRAPEIINVLLQAVALWGYLLITAAGEIRELHFNPGNPVLKYIRLKLAQNILQIQAVQAVPLFVDQVDNVNELQHY